MSEPDPNPDLEQASELSDDASAQGAEDVKFLAGVEKGIKAVKFPVTAVEALPPGKRPALLTTRRDRDGATTHKMNDILPLYRFADGRERGIHGVY